jgi:hypothetical protein
MGSLIREGARARLAPLLALLVLACTDFPFGVVFVSVAPPPMMVESIGPRPPGDVIWIEGRWDWRPREYYWVPGVWLVRPFPGARFAPGRWKHHAHGWYWEPGHWR